MLDAGDLIHKGHVYGDGKGNFRKVRRFTNTLGVEVSTPLNVWYVRCTESGALIGKGIEQKCWVSTFLQWKKGYIGDVGNLPPMNDNQSS